MADQLDGVDFALAAYREEGVWQVEELAHDVLTDVETLSHALRRFPGDGGAVGMIAIRPADPPHRAANLRRIATSPIFSSAPPTGTMKPRCCSSTWGHSES